LSSAGQSTRMSAVKSQPHIAPSATIQSDHDGVFRRPTLPLRRSQRVTCASTSPREPLKRRLFAADKLKLQPVVLLRPLAHVLCTKKSADPCPSPAQSEFDQQLLKTAREDRDVALSHTGQCRPTRVWSAGGQTDRDGWRKHKQSTSGRPVHSAVVPHKQLSHRFYYTTEGDTGQWCIVYA